MTITKYTSYSYKYKVHIRKKEHLYTIPTIQQYNVAIRKFAYIQMLNIHSRLFSTKQTPANADIFPIGEKTFSTAHRATSTTDRRKPAKKPHIVTTSQPILFNDKFRICVIVDFSTSAFASSRSRKNESPNGNCMRSFAIELHSRIPRKRI